MITTRNLVTLSLIVFMVALAMAGPSEALAMIDDVFFESTGGSLY